MPYTEPRRTRSSFPCHHYNKICSFYQFHYPTRYRSLTVKCKRYPLASKYHLSAANSTSSIKSFIFSLPSPLPRNGLTLATALLEVRYQARHPAKLYLFLVLKNNLLTLLSLRSPPDYFRRSISLVPACSVCSRFTNTASAVAPCEATYSVTF